MFEVGVRPSFATGFAHSPGESEYPDLWRGLVGAWDMSLGQTGTKVLDLSGKGNIGSFGAGAASPTWVGGKYGPALDFDGGDYVEINKAVPTGPPITMVAWFKSSDTDNLQSIMCLADELSGTDYFSLDAYGSQVGDPVIAVVRNGGIDIAETTKGYTANTWHQAVAVFRANGTHSAYIDGGNRGDNATSGVPSTPTRLHLGQYADSTPTSPLTGGIDHVMIYNRALIVAEIALLYHLRKRQA